MFIINRLLGTAAPKKTVDEKFNDLERSLRKQKGIIAGHAQRMNRTADHERQQAYDSIRRGDKKTGWHHNFQAAVAGAMHDRLQDGVRKIDAFALQIPLARAQASLLQTMDGCNAGRQELLNGLSTTSPQKIAEIYEEHNREFDLYNKDLENVLYGPLGAVEERAQQEANEMTEHMLQEFPSNTEATGIVNNAFAERA